MIRPMVFDHLIWVKSVASDLIPELCRHMLAFDFGLLLRSSLLFQVVQSGLEDTHGHLSVLRLRPLILDRDYDS